MTQVYANTINITNETYRNDVNIVSVNLNNVNIQDNTLYLGFDNCPNLISVNNISNNVQHLEYAFRDCVNLSEISHIPNSITNMHAAFKNCVNLETIPAINGCLNLAVMSESFNGSGIVTVPSLPDSVKQLRYTFLNCQNLINISKLSNSAEDISQICRSDSKLQIIENETYMPNLTNAYRAFEGCSNLSDTKINFGSEVNFNDFSLAFHYCSNLINLPNMSGNFGNLYYSFQQCSNLVNVNIVINSADNMEQTFARCNNIVGNIDISNCNSITTLNRTFYRCYNLTSFGKIPDNIVNMTGTFQQCSNLVPNENLLPNYITDLSYCFQQCGKIVNAPVIPNTIVNMSHAFDYCSKLENVPDMSNCSNIDEINGCFDRCINLSGEIIIGSEQISNAIDCFNNTSLKKYVYIPFNVTVNKFVPSDFCLETNTGMTLYTKQKYTSEEESISGVYTPSYMRRIDVLYDENGNLLEGYVDTPGYNGVFNIGLWNNSTETMTQMTAEYNSSRDKGAYQDVSEYSLTYNSFKTASYGTDPNDRVNGVLLRDLYNIPSTNDWRYVIDADGNKLLYEYLGSNIDIEVPYFKTMLNDYTSGTTPSEANTPFYNNPNINKVDLQFVPWKNDSMVDAFKSSPVKGVYNINENVTSMRHTFYGCRSLLEVPEISESTVNMHQTFYYCQNLLTAPVIPSSVTYMRHAFYYCRNLTGDILIYSDSITNAMNCFTGTSLDKNVYIPFNYANGKSSKTYNSFTTAGYGTDPNNRVNGVCLMDLASYQN